MAQLALQGQLYQAVDKRRVREARGLPELGVHGDAGEAGNGVDLVEPHRGEVAGHEEITIGGHTVNHVIMTLCSDDKLRVEIEECRRKLEEITGEPIRSFAYPAGQCDARGPEYLREIGYLLAATTEARFVAPATNPFLVPRFCVPDEVTFPEAICNMLGIWHPFLNRVKKLLRLAPPQPYAAPVDNRKNTAGGKYASQ